MTVDASTSAVVGEASRVLPESASFTPDAAEAFLASVPAKWCVALLIDGAGRALQLVCAKNLRAFLRRRLEAPDPAELVAASKRLDYRELVRRVAWRRVDGEFEMDLVYIDAARAAFPTHWRQLVPDRSAHFVRLDVDDRAPDFVREDTTEATGQIWGPFPDRAKAERWIDAARDAFDLCRYRNILAQAPRGRACAYKQMNKCPAPCDGTVSLDAYHGRLREAVTSLRSPAAAVEVLTGEMKRQAASLDFEAAARTKSRLATLAQLSAAPFAAVRPIDAFRFVSVQPGPRKGTARIFAITTSGAAEIAGVIGDAVTMDDVRAIESACVPTSTRPGEVLLGTVCYHLAGPKSAARFVATSALTAEGLASLLAAAMKPQPASHDADAVRETRLVNA